MVEGDWNEDFLIDLEAFPNSGEDVVDALSGAHSCSGTNKTGKTVNRMKSARRKKTKMDYLGKSYGR